MNNDAIDATFREAGTAVAVRQEDDAASPALFGTSDPIEIVQKAVRVADALKAVVVSKKLISNIQGKEYPQVEAWLTLAAMLRLTTICEWSRPVEDGWEARVIVRDARGNTVGAAEAQCLKTERSKKSWEDYAIRSMAQTRSTSKALRSVLAFIMTLAGFQPTPAEEMPDPAPPSQPSSAPRGMTKNEAAAAKATAGGAIKALSDRWMEATGESEGAWVEFARTVKAGGGDMDDLRRAVQNREKHGPRRTHSHAYCAVGPDPEKGHDHYCPLAYEPCDDETCWGGSDPEETLYDDTAPQSAPESALFPEPARSPQATPTGRGGAATGCLRGCTTSGHAKDCANGPMTENQRGLLFALHGDLKHDDVGRHAFYEAVAGVRSSRELTRATAKLTIDALRAEKEAGL